MAGSLMRCVSRSSTRRISPWPGRNARIEPIPPARPESPRPPSGPRCARWRLGRDSACRPGRRGLRLRDRRAAKELRDPRAVERRRHRQNAQVIAQAALAVERERETEVGIERALMELVEQHRADTGKLGIIEDHSGEDALGDDLDACLRPRFRDHPRAQSDRSPTASDRECAMRSAAARAAIRRGSSTRIFDPGASLRSSRRVGRASSCRRRWRNEDGRRERPEPRAIRPGRRQSEAVERTPCGCIEQPLRFASAACGGHREHGIIRRAFSSVHGPACTELTDAIAVISMRAGLKSGNQPLAPAAFIQKPTWRLRRCLVNATSALQTMRSCGSARRQLGRPARGPAERGDARR